MSAMVGAGCGWGAGCGVRGAAGVRLERSRSVASGYRTVCSLSLVELENKIVFQWTLPFVVLRFKTTPNFGITNWYFRFRWNYLHKNV